MRLLVKISLLTGLTAGLGTGCSAILGLDDFSEGVGTGGSSSVSSSSAESSSSGVGGATGSGGATASSSSSGSTTSSTSTTSGTGGMVDCNSGETIAAMQSSPNGITAFGTNVFWANTGDGAIMTWSPGSIPSLWYTTGVNGPEHISANAHQVCWTDTNNNFAECKSDVPNNMFPHSIVEMGGTAQPTSIVLDDTYAYWTTPYNGEVKKKAVPATNANSTPVIPISATPSDVPDRIAVDAAGAVYWVNYSDNSISGRAPSDIVQAPPLVTNQPGISGLAVDANDVFWSSSTGKSVFKAPKLTGMPITPLATGQLYPEQVTIDATDVYWWNQGDGTIMKTPKSGGPATVVICGQTDVHFAVSATHVYWTDRKNGTVKRIPK